MLWACCRSKRLIGVCGKIRGVWASTHINHNEAKRLPLIVMRKRGTARCMQALLHTKMLVRAKHHSHLVRDAEAGNGVPAPKVSSSSHLVRMIQGA
ncbi:hypothetical protein AVEN_189504-1 [Araneus ventricosus]|uniref:Uncharacterized protein n=1 Tax=Araneus ventricosus TaxID=182803 RepID=A0A4Y2T7E3_ARAVE|nr:hypothetical protein AVEN_189504-1 [Araneus ventricosus]